MGRKLAAIGLSIGLGVAGCGSSHSSPEARHETQTPTSTLPQGLHGQPAETLAQKRADFEARLRAGHTQATIIMHACALVQPTGSTEIDIIPNPAEISAADSRTGQTMYQLVGYNKLNKQLVYSPVLENERKIGGEAAGKVAILAKTDAANASITVSLDQHSKVVQNDATGQPIMDVAGFGDPGPNRTFDDFSASKMAIIGCESSWTAVAPHSSNES